MYDIYEDMLNMGEIKKVEKRMVPEKHLSMPICIGIFHRLKDIVDDYFSKVKIDLLNDLTTKDVVKKIKEKYKNDHTRNYSNLLLMLDNYVDYYRRHRVHPTWMVPEMYPELINGYELEEDMNLDRVLEISTEISHVEIDGYLNWVRDIIPVKEYIKLKGKLRKNFRISDYTYTAYRKQKFWSRIVDQDRHRAEKNQNRVKVTGSGLVFFLGSNYHLMFKKGSKECFIMTPHQLQMIQDCCISRFNTMLACDMGLHNGSKDIRELVLTQVDWQDNLIRTYGNKGYDLVKSPEALMKAWLTTLSKGDVLTPSTFERMCAKVIEKEEKISKALGVKNYRLVDQYIKFIEERVTNYDDTCELFGMIKLSGHPTVSAGYSGQGLKSVVHSYRMGFPQCVRELGLVFKHMILEGYIRKHQQWPDFSFPPVEGKLKRFYDQRTTSLPMRLIDLEDYRLVTFGKMYEFDYCEDYLSLIDDKAICPGRKDTVFFWYTESQVGRVQETDRRLLRQILKTPIDMKAICERMSKGGFHEDEYIVEVSQKEKEFKEQARCFAKFKLEVRLYWLCLETNVKRMISDLFPEITMVKSEADEKKQIYGLVSDNKSKSKVRTEIDLSHWNGSWRDKNTRPMNKVLDDCFGMKGAWNQFFPFFKNAIVVITEKHQIPTGANPKVPIERWPDSDMLIRNWDGGQEGTLQACWTMYTVVANKWILYRLNLTYTCAGQGDNHVFTFDFGTTDEDKIAAELDKALLLMSFNYKMIGHELKVIECQDSREVLTYSKKIYVSGSHKMFCLKFISKAYERSDNSIPSLSRDVSSIMANSLQIADNLKSPIEAVYWKNFMLINLLSERKSSLVHIREHKYLRMLFNNKKMMKFVALIPGSCGGLPIIPWTRFMMKGETDDLSWDVPAYLNYQDEVDTIRTDCHNLANGVLSPEKPDLVQLMDDPHSIPINRPIDNTSLIKRCTEDGLKTRHNNKELSQIINSGMGKDDLKVALLQTKPLYPDLMREIYDVSLPGLSDRFLGKFCMTRTLSKINPDVQERIVEGGVLLLKYMIDRYKLANTIKLSKYVITPYEYCQTLRNLWSCGLKNSNIGVYTPFDFKLFLREKDEPWISCQTRGNIRDFFNKPGGYPPNFGTKTRAKVSTHGYKVYESSGTIKDLMKITLLSTQMGTDPKLEELLNKICVERSPWEIHQLRAVLPVSIGGCAQHRAERNNQSHFAILGSNTVPTNLNYCSDDAGILSGGIDDVPVPFQAFYLTMSNIVSVLADAELDIGSLQFGFKVPEVLDVIDNSPVRWVGKTTGYKSRDITGNKLATIDKIYTSVVPKEPSPRICRVILNPQKRPKDLIYSNLLSTMPLMLESLPEQSEVINMPIDIMDFKEYLAVDHEDLMKAVALFIIAEGTFRSGSTLVGVNQHISDLSTKLGALLARMFVHPLSRTYKVYRGRNLSAGKNSERGLARKVADDLCSEILDLLENPSKVEAFSLILFSESEEKQTQKVVKHALAMLFAQDSTRYGKVNLNDNQIRLVRDIWLGPGNDNINNLIKSYNQLFFTQKGRRSEFNGYPKLRFMHYRGDSKTALRCFRRIALVKKDYKNKPIPSIEVSPHKAKFTRTETTGMHVPKVINYKKDYKENLELYLQTSRRPYGRYTGIMSDWLAILKMNKIYKQDKSVTSIGVGDGGAAAAFLTLAKNGKVMGIDLKSSFPTIVSREGGYKPAEVVEHGLDSDFYWSKHTQAGTGDVFELITFPEGNLMIDLDLPQQRITHIINRLHGTGTFIWRQLLDLEHLKAVMSVMPKASFYWMGFLTDMEQTQWVIVGDRMKDLTNDIDYTSVEIHEVERSTYKIHNKGMRKERFELLTNIGEKWFPALDIPNIRDGLSHIKGLAKYKNGPDRISRDKEIKDIEDALYIVENDLIGMHAMSSYNKRVIRLVGLLKPMVIEDDMDIEGLKRI